MSKNKIAAIIAWLLMMCIALSSVFSATAQTIPAKKTYAYIIAQPNPVGVGQPVKLIFGITDYLNEWPDGWTGITITVEQPDGKTKTLGPFKTDPTGSTGTTFIPETAGTYYFQVHFPEQVYNWTV
ncbi:MAG: hypothetical protein QXZ70_05595, partial [Candidatus Bathyarchaeia archaeon]